MTVSRPTSHSLVWRALLLALFVVLALQARSLYIFPQPDGARWWGDETGQMLELTTELHQGYASIPTALGSSVAISNGFVRSNSWLAALLYGIPVTLLDSVWDPVTVGRTITFLLALTMLGILYKVMQRMGVRGESRLVALVLLASSRSFFYGSHAARLDIAAGLAILMAVWHVGDRYARLRDSGVQPTSVWWFGYGCVAILLSTLSIHLLTLIGAWSLFVLWKFRSVRRSNIGMAIAGVAVTMLLLTGIYWLAGAPMTLYGDTIRPNQFQSVVSGLPILRPFSRSVQIANLVERLHGLWSEAPAILISVVASSLLLAVFRRQIPFNAFARFVALSAVVFIVSWLLFEGPALYYYMQILGIACAVAVCILDSIVLQLRIPRYLLAALTIALAVIGGMDALRVMGLAKQIDLDNSSALQRAYAIVQSENNGTPAVLLAQNPALSWLTNKSAARLMTPHLVDFPVRDGSLASQLHTVNVRYLLLYAPASGGSYSSDYAALRPIADSFATIRLRVSGILTDVDRDYFRNGPLHPDTLILYQF